MRYLLKMAVSLFRIMLSWEHHAWKGKEKDKINVSSEKIRKKKLYRARNLARIVHTGSTIGPHKGVPSL